MLCVPTSSQIEDGNFETFFIFLFFICMLSMRSDPYSLIFFIYRGQEIKSLHGLITCVRMLNFVIHYNYQMCTVGAFVLRK